MKPSPSSSISKNLIDRLNELSSPVARRLKFWNKKSFQVNQYDPSFKVIYLGNLGMQFWSKDENCLEKPLNTLWSNYLVNMKTEIVMHLTICNSGLKAITRQHGLTQYWSNRLIYCCTHKNYPKVFAWVYRHEGKKMRQELRCHAVFCTSPERATKMTLLLNQRLTHALQEFKREKKSRTTSFSIMNASSNLATYEKAVPRTIPLRRQILAKGSANFRPPHDRSKSAPKLTSIIEEDSDVSQSDEFDPKTIFIRNQACLNRGNLDQVVFKSVWSDKMNSLRDKDKEPGGQKSSANNSNSSCLQLDHNISSNHIKSDQNSSTENLHNDHSQVETRSELIEKRSSEEQQKETEVITSNDDATTQDIILSWSNLVIK